MTYPKGPRIKIEVNKERITTAVTADSGRCMIADSIKVAYPNATSVAADLQTCRFSDLDKGHRYVYMTPYSAQLALLHFDEGKAPEPFSFWLKNAHVTKAGSTPRSRERSKAWSKKKQEQEKLKHQKLKQTLTQTRLVGGDKRSGSLPRRVGGRRPPQLRSMRLFGVRAFRGASLDRLHTDAKIVELAETMGLTTGEETS